MNCLRGLLVLFAAYGCAPAADPPPESFEQLRDRLLTQLKAVREFNTALRGLKNIPHQRSRLDQYDRDFDGLQRSIERCFRARRADVLDRDDLTYRAEFRELFCDDLPPKLANADDYLRSCRTCRYTGVPDFSFDAKKVGDALEQRFAQMQMDALAARKAGRYPLAEPESTAHVGAPRAGTRKLGDLHCEVGPDGGLIVSLPDSDEEVAGLAGNPEIKGVSVPAARKLTPNCAWSLARWPNLTAVRLEPGTPFRGEALLMLAQIKTLRHLTLRQPSYFDFPRLDPVGDGDLVYVAKITQLESLDVQGRAVTGGGVAALARLPRLKALTVRHYAWSDDPVYGPADSLLAGLAAAPALERLSVSADRLGSRRSGRWPG